MGFAETLKLEVRRRAHFRCCLCHAVGIEVHHIHPEAEGGSDDQDNAAPLCPTCHETYGANPLKRKFIREARDLWFEICAERFVTDAGQLEEMKRLLNAAATKDDLDVAIRSLTRAIQTTVGTPAESREAGSSLSAELRAAPVTEASVKCYLRTIYPTVRHCGQDELRKLTADLLAVGYDTVGMLHDVVEGTGEALADVVRASRDRGDPTDTWFDSIPIRLFLPIFDERYCRTYYPLVYTEHVNDSRPMPWRRRDSPRPA